MIGVIIACHGELASEIVSVAEEIMGEQRHLEAISVKVGESKDNLRSKLDIVMNMMDVDGVLILLDLFGSSFSNSCMYFAQKRTHVAVVTGVNLPMVLKVLTHRDSMDLKNLVSLACKGGKDGILDACGWLSEKVGLNAVSS